MYVSHIVFGQAASDRDADEAQSDAELLQPRRPALSSGRVIEADVVHDSSTTTFDAAVVRSWSALATA